MIKAVEIIPPPKTRNRVDPCPPVSGKFNWNRNGIGSLPMLQSRPLLDSPFVTVNCSGAVSFW